MLHLTLALAALAAAQPTTQEWKIGQPVKTTSGTIVGQPSSWQPGVSEYLGVPFAKAPAGELRWAAPQAITDDSKTINATKLGYACPESGSRYSPDVSASGASKAENQREDCLHLNIHTKPQVGEKKKAVLVWVYGGGFVVGSNENPAYNGALLVEEHDIVTVAINYRLSALGFPGVALPEKNLGLLDQRKALEWIRDNIEKFGGDPKRITIHGQSAGGASVDYYTYAWTQDPIIAGVIPQSGSAAIRPAPPGNATVDAVGQWSNLSNKLGCGAVAAADVTKSLACMRSKSLKEVMDATAPAPGGGLQMGTWGPKIDNKIVFEDLTERGNKGQFIKVPILVGNTDNEGANSGNKVGSKEALRSNCGPRRAAQLRRDAGVPAWRYIYAGEFENQKKGPCNAKSEGACHSAEISITFGTNALKKAAPDTENEKKLSTVLRKAWATFAKDPVHGLETFGWPKYDKTQASVIVIGGKDSDKITFEKTDKLDTECPV